MVTPVVGLVVGKGKAAYSYQGMPKPDDGRVILKFDVGDVIDLLNTEDPNWWEVKLQTLLFMQEISSIDLYINLPALSICVGNWNDFHIANYWIGIAKLD